MSPQRAPRTILCFDWQRYQDNVSCMHFNGPVERFDSYKIHRGSSCDHAQRALSSSQTSLVYGKVSRHCGDIGDTRPARLPRNAPEPSVLRLVLSPAARIVLF
jgi:hypothetical protein